jgi:hypothetical protein
MSQRVDTHTRHGTSQSNVAIGEVGFDSVADDAGADFDARNSATNESHIQVPLEGSDIKLVNPLLEASHVTRGSSGSLVSVPTKAAAATLPTFSVDLVDTAVPEEQRPQFTTADVERLQLIISDLSRRLQNAQHTIEAQRDIAKRSAALSERFRRELGEAHNRKCAPVLTPPSAVAKPCICPSVYLSNVYFWYIHFTSYISQVFV